MTTPDEIIDFWFDHPAVADGRHPSLWWTKDDEVDAEIRRRFGRDVERAIEGGFADWTQTARGTLALVILLDQFTRNIHRGTPRAFAGDSRALELGRAAVERGVDLALPPFQRAFLYMPLEHAEDVRAQAESIAAFERLVADAEPPFESGVEAFLDFARRHKEVIDRFGRYPHRNEILGRTSTDEELTFLQLPGSSF